MKKLKSVFTISFSQEFTYRMNFIMWRVRNVLQIILIYFLWDTVYSNATNELFGYDKSQMLTYVFMLFFVKAAVLSTRAVDVAGELSRGELNNYLVKPVSYIFYWFTRDISTKTLNILFAVSEMAILYILIQPPFYLQSNSTYLIAFFVLIVISAVLCIMITICLSFAAFWIPEGGAWGIHFLFTAVISQFLTGSLFPIDILPTEIVNIISFTPFPYLVYFPIQVYLGKVSDPEILKVISIGIAWLILFYLLVKCVWKKGLKVYQAYGR